MKLMIPSSRNQSMSLKDKFIDWLLDEEVISLKKVNTVTGSSLSILAFKISYECKKTLEL